MQAGGASKARTHREVAGMNIRPKIVAAAVAALALGGLGIGATVAASAAGTAGVHAVVSHETTGPDTDAIQQGDQTSPDTPGGTAAAKAAHAGGAKASSGEEDG